MFQYVHYTIDYPEVAPRLRKEASLAKLTTDTGEQVNMFPPQVQLLT